MTVGGSSRTRRMLADIRWPGVKPASGSLASLNVDGDTAMDVTSVLWIGIGLGAGVFAINVLWQRYVSKTPRAVQSGGSYLLFGLLMLAFAIFSIGMGVFITV